MSSYASAIRAVFALVDLILAIMMMVTLPSKFLLSTEPRCLNSGTTGRLSVPHLDRGDRLIGQEKTARHHWQFLGRAEAPPKRGQPRHAPAGWGWGSTNRFGGRPVPGPSEMGPPPTSRGQAEGLLPQYTYDEFGGALLRRPASRELGGVNIHC